MASPRVLVTGASSGIGRAAARQLGERGATVIVLARTAAELEAAAREVRVAGGSAIVAVADVTDPDALRAAVDGAVKEAGGLDVAIVNAGAAAYGELRDMSPKDVHDTVDVTLLGAANTVLAALPHLELSGGRIVATGSVAALQPQPLMAAYSAAKHGVDGLMESLRLELAAVGSNVSVAVVHPGPVDTPFWKHVRPVGTRPPEPPAAYSVDRVARAVVGAALGSRGSSPVGVAMRLALLMRGVARPFSDLGLAAVARWALDNPGSSQLRTFVRRALSSA